MKPDALLRHHIRRDSRNFLTPSRSSEPQKHGGLVIDTNLKEYIHKAVGICGVSAGGLGGTRVIQNLLPVMRELGLVTIFWDGNFPSVQNLFDANGTLLDQAHLKRVDKFIKELVWMAQTLRY